MEAERQGVTTFRPYTHAGLLACATADGSWDEWDRHFEALNEGEVRNRDITDSLAMAGELAGRVGQLTRARAALKLALENYRHMSADREAGRVEALLSSLEP